MNKFLSLWIIIFISGCTTQSNNPSLTLIHKISPITNPIIIKPIAFKKITILSDEIDYVNEEKSESNIFEYRSNKNDLSLNYEMSGSTQNINLLLKFKYIPASNTITDVVVDTDNKEITKFLNDNNFFEKVIQKSLLTEFFQRELLSDMVVSKDLSESLNEMYKSTGSITLMEATSKYKILGITNIKGRSAVAVSMNGSISMKVAIKNQSNRFNMITRGNLFIDKKTGMVIESDVIGSIINGSETTAISANSMRLIQFIE